MMNDTVFHTPTVLTIDRQAIAENYRRLAEQASGKPVAAVVKANAYGLGAAAVAPVLQQAGCNFFYVAHLDEALKLRAIVGPTPRIAVLHGIPGSAYTLAQQHVLIPVLNTLGDIAAWREAARTQDVRPQVIIQLDTGMNRLGLGVDEVEILVEQAGALNGLCLQFWLSHLACADEPAHPMNEQQVQLLMQFLIKLPPAPVSFANSSGIFLGPNYWYDQVRPGCALYGVNPTPGRTNPMRAVVRLEAPILQLRDVPPWVSVGYGASWRSKRLGKAATLPVGYADGFLRSLSNAGLAYCSGHPAPIIGRVSMDLMVIDVTDVPDAARQPGMMVELLGPKSGRRCSCGCRRNHRL